MTVLTVDTKGTNISYLDSGPIHNDTHVTLFFLHGHTFYSPIFKHLMPFATKYNIRIVALTRRDYVGSTPFNSSELNVITHGDTAAKTAFLRDRALEIATFLEKFTQENKIPKASQDGAQGGIALLGWSLGNVQALSVVGLVRELPENLVESLAPYLKALVLYECPVHSLGIPPPDLENIYHPLRDQTIPKEDLYDRFTAWVSGYFKHADIASRDVAALEYVHPSQHRRATTASIPREELAAVTDPAPGARSEDPFLMGTRDLNLMGRIKEQVFFPTDNTSWPQLKVKMVWGTESTWSMPYAVWGLEKYVQEGRSMAQGKPQRPLDVYAIEGVNHFAHWDDPEKLMQVFAQALTS